MANEFVARKGLIVSGSASISGSVTASVGFLGNLTGTSSFAASASAATSITFNPVSSSYALTASYASNVSAADFNTLLNKPTLVSSSAQVNTGSFTGSFTGNFLGSASFATTASYATSTTWNSVNNKPTVVSASAQINTGSFTGSFTGGLLGSASYAPTSWVDINNKPVGILSGSTQINLLSGVSASWASQSLSSSYAFSSSYAVSASWSPGSAGGDFNTLVNKPTLVSSSAQINTGSFTGSFTGNIIGTITSATYAATASSANDFRVRRNFSSYGIGGDVTNVAIGDDALLTYVTLPQGAFNVAVGVTSLRNNISGTVNTAIGYAALYSNISGTNNVALGASTLYNNIRGGSNVAIGGNSLLSNIEGTGNTAIGANVLQNNNANNNVAIGQLSQFSNVSGTENVSIGNQTSYFNVSGNYNTAIGHIALNRNVSGSNNVAIGYNAGYWETGSNSFYVAGFGYGSLMEMQTSSLFYGQFAQDASSQMLRINARASMSQNVLAMQGITGSLQGSASYALSASWAPGGGAADFNTLLNKPTLVSSSAQVNTGSFTGSFTGNLLGSASYALSSSYAMSASWAPGGGAADFNTLLNKPTLVSSSAQINTGSFTGSFTGNFLGSASYALSSSAATSITFVPATASFATTASAATSITFLPTSASYAGTSWGAINNKPTVVSASAQVNTGSFTGSFTGNFLGSASYALSSSYASIAQSIIGTITSASWAAYAVSSSYVTGTIGFPAGLIVTGSVTASVGYTGSVTGNLLGTSSYANTSSVLTNRHGDTFTTPSIGTNVTYTGSVDLGRTWMLMGIEADRAARVRMYATTGSRFTDGLRGIGIDPSASAGVLADFVFTAAGKLMVTPVIVGSNMEGIVSSSTPFLIENRSGGASTVAITFTTIKVE